MGRHGKMGRQKSGKQRHFMTILKKLFKKPTPTQVPHMGFCLCFAVVLALGSWVVTNQLNLKAFFPQSFQPFYGYFLAIIIGVLSTIFNKIIIRFIEKRYNEQNTNRWLWANVFFGILSIYLFFTFLFFL